jgi:hypothetical protein
MTLMNSLRSTLVSQQAPGSARGPPGRGGPGSDSTTIFTILSVVLGPLTGMNTTHKWPLMPGRGSFHSSIAIWLRPATQLSEPSAPAVRPRKHVFGIDELLPAGAE